MSWFDAAGFANLAKSALKEAQKTIDKALDIKEEDQRPTQLHTDESSDFFASWGLKAEEDAKPNFKSKEKPESSSSIWGSFTGSFFETSKLGEGDVPKRISQSKSLQTTPVESAGKPQLLSSLSLPERSSNSIVTDIKNIEELQDGSNFKQQGTIPTKDTSCASQESSDLESSKDIDTPSDTEKTKSRISSATEENDSSTETHDTSATNQSDECPNVQEQEEYQITEEDELEQEKKSIHDQDLLSANALNRISIISSESDKKSLGSVEVLGSHSNTDCTTTPESDGNSRSNSGSPSAVGPKVNSESVEILPDSSVTSPSSVEILGDWKSDTSPYLSPVEPKYSESSIMEKDESVTPCWEDVNVAVSFNEKNEIEPSSSDISPYQSPIEEGRTLSNSCTSSVDTTPSPSLCPSSHSSRSISSSHNFKISPESVEVISDVDELDEASLAEDSYTSASESTVMTILETFQQLEQVKCKMEGTIATGKMHDSCPDGRQIPNKVITSDAQLNLSLDSLKEKHNLHLPLEPITTQPIRKTEYLEATGKKAEIDAFDRLLNATIEPPEPERFTEPVHILKLESTETSDQYLMLTDSSCEGTLIESSSEENPAMNCKTESKIIETQLTASSYVKTMLADAMVEKNEIIDTEVHGPEVLRENSPISSESRSDLVKIGSDQTSGHTSGDELETTTSSDIEIISSPNGDSSSTQSRQSPAKLQLAKGADLLTKTLKTRGHSRELSEISIGSDETNLEIEKLLKRIQEMTEILEARESKLIDVSRMNMELHEQNSNLKKQLDNFERHAEQSQNLNQITDEYTQRLSALERKFQQAIRERDSLRKNLEQLKVEAATRLSSQEMSSISAEKDEIIKELREEGEKLSKQQLQHSNIIKKLRVKEKENDAFIKNQKEQIEEQNSELERLKRSLHAKEEVERSQIEAVHTLTAKTKKQEKEILSLQEKLDNTQHKMDAYKRSLDAAKVDLAETKKLLTETEAELKEATNNAGESCQLLAQVEDLKMKLRQSEETHAKKEEFFKHENAELLKRLEAAEARSEELSESVSMATKPLLRQLEQLQANLLHKSNSFMKQEKVLSEKNMELQSKVENLLEMDRYLKEENLNLKSQVSQLESKLTSKDSETSNLQELYDKLVQENEKMLEQIGRYRRIIETMEQSHESQIKELQREISALENKVTIEKAATDAEKRKNNAILEQQQSIDEDLRLSPTPSIGRDSASSISNIWPVLNDSIIESSSGRYTMVYDSVRAGSSSTSIFENLQSQLKQRDGEIQQLQWELSRRNTERDALNTELSTLTLQIEELNNKMAEVQALNENLGEIQTRYDALLQMYGEKMEENQELRLDLEDIKEMYKTQIDQLLKRDT